MVRAGAVDHPVNWTACAESRVYWTPIPIQAGHPFRRNWTPAPICEDLRNHLRVRGFTDRNRCGSGVSPLRLCQVSSGPESVSICVGIHTACGYHELSGPRQRYRVLGLDRLLRCLEMPAQSESFQAWYEATLTELYATGYRVRDPIGQSASPLAARSGWRPWPKALSWGRRPPSRRSSRLE
jgi:hypothetical protein